MGENISSVRVIKFIEENQNRLYRMAYGYMKNEQDALDAVHDAIVKILQNKDKIRRGEYFETWAYRILINECLMALRKQKHVLTLYDEDEMDDRGDMQKQQEDAVDLYHAMDRLPPKLKTVILLRFFEEMKLDEIAAVTGEKLSTVKSRLYKAMKLLRLDLEVQDED